MPVTLAQPAVAGTATSGTTVAATFGSNTTTSNTIVVFCGGFGATSANLTVTGVAINAGSAIFTKQVGQISTAGGYADTEFWAAANITGGTTPQVTVTFTGGTIQNADTVIYEFSGMPTSLTTDGSGSGKAGTSSATPTTPSLTTTGTNDVLFAGFNTVTSISAGSSGWAIKLTTSCGGCSEYLITSSTQSGTFSATQSAGTYNSVIFALQGSVSAVLPVLSTNPKIIYP